MRADFLPSRFRLDDPASGRDDGWTLVEMLVALSLLALIGVLATAALSGAGRAFRLTEGRAAQTAIEAAGAHIRNVVSQARPLRRPGAGTDAPLLAGDRRSLTLVTSHAPAGQYGGLYVVEIFLVPSARAGLADLMEVRTLYRQSPLLGQEEPARPSIRSRLVADVVDLTLSYYGSADGEAGRAWHESWSDAVTLPELISVEVALAPGDRRSWGALTIAVPTRQ